MCGIVGTTKKHNTDSIIKSLDILKHRGPDQFGYDDFGPVFGHRRLSIIDLSESGKQPMFSNSGLTAIVFNGEIYNYQLLKTELSSKGVKFKNMTDTEVILEGYEKEGVGFFNKMRGMWAFAIYDSRREEVIISRDQFGIKPLYYSIYQNELFFASELKAFKAFDIPKEPNTDFYNVFFNLGYFCAPETCFKYIKALMPGETIIYNCVKNTTELFLIKKPTLEVKNYIVDEFQVIKQLDSVLQESIESHYIADVPVGILFSGGNDSALIAALSLVLGKKPKAFHLSVEGSVDTEYAHKIGKMLGLPFQSVAMTQVELLNQYDEVWDILDAPFSDPSIITTSLIYKKIEGQTKVVLSGEGGDEWFGGYPRHNNLANTHSVYQSNKFLSVMNVFYGYSQMQLKYTNPILLRIRDQYFKYGDDVVGQYLRETKNIDLPIQYNSLRKYLYELYQKNHSSHPGLFFDETLYLVNDLLFKNDLASMASSIEARVPFVDRQVYDFIQQYIPPQMRLSSQYSSKFLLKKVLEKYLPHELVYRRKSGFSFSFSRYHVPTFSSDVQQALKFHCNNAEVFGIKNKKIFNAKMAETLIVKYPRFAFGLVSNWKVFKNFL